jgi:serine/threonine protein kinase
MTLAVGTKLGPYEVLAPLGAGGMGEVYRARDTKLNRDVALKVLPEAFARDPARMARFQREAQVLASLNHPNIASVYGLEESGGVRALVMELVEGTSLKERIAGAGLVPAQGCPQGAPLRVDILLDLAIQIAGGLDAAHHRKVLTL